MLLEAQEVIGENVSTVSMVCINNVSSVIIVREFWL